MSDAENTPMTDASPDAENSMTVEQATAIYQGIVSKENPNRDFSDLLSAARTLYDSSGSDAQTVQQIKTILHWATENVTFSS